MTEKPNKPKAKQLPAAMRWTVQHAAMEFPIDEKTLASRLMRAGTLPGKDRRYSTAQICAQVYGDLKQAQTRLAAAQADAAEVELAIARKQVVTVAEVLALWQNVGFAVRRIVLTSELSKERQDAILRELEAFKAGDLNGGAA